MPHEELREKNIRLVIENALDSFLENGIEKTKVADVALIDRMSHENSDGGTTGLEDAANVLVCYSMLYHLDPKGMRFTLDAELTLQAAGRLHEIKNQPPEPFETSGGPMAKAIRKGLADGSISPDVDVKEIYYNSYDAILGIMQRLSIGGSPSARELDYDSRMLHLSEMFVKALSGK